MTHQRRRPLAPYAELAAVVRGDLIVPGDPGYDQARAVYNAMIDKTRRPSRAAGTPPTSSPACGSPGEHGVAIAVRGGGHNAAGLGVADDALVIDLSMLRSMTVDPKKRHRPGRRGRTWGDVDHATVAFGMATPSGFSPHRRRRPDAGRRHRLPDPALRPRPSTTSYPPTSSWRTDVVTASESSNRICSGRCAVVAATSASSPRSCSAATTSASTAWSSAARSCTTSPTPPK